MAGGGMNMQELIKPLIQRNSTRIIFTILDGLGGLPDASGKTELEAADTPNLDALARGSACGMHLPVTYGITPGSGPGHLGVFGYDPCEHQIGRGILEALGLGLEVEKTDVAVRCNYATLKDGVIIDRRAGRIPTEQSRALTERLQNRIPKIGDAEIILAPGMEHRFALLIRFPEPLSAGEAAVKDTDPQKEGKPPLQAVPESEKAERVADIVSTFIARAQDILHEEEKANFVLTRGFSGMPHLPSFQEAFGLRAVAVATYPMYRGLARLVGMDTPVVKGNVEDQVEFLKNTYDDYDFFFLHVKKIDSYGEDGDFAGKKKQIEEFDGLLPRLLALKPDVTIITGDHSTPSSVKSHSWHPVPVILNSPHVIGGMTSAFSEKECFRGELGVFQAVNIMPLALANSWRLKKFGA